MLSDFDILRIAETKDVALIRKAYRTLVKEVHPDVAEESDLIRNHLLFIQINKAYRRLIGRYGIPDTRAAGPVNSGANPGAAVVRHKDPAYAFYKTAMTQFMKIHPSQWSVETEQTLAKPGPGQMKELEKIKAKVRNLARLFPKAYYYFSIVVHEYPDSIWVQDAREKMTLIEERTGRYRKIIESFTEHAREVPRVNRMFFRRR